MLLGFLKENNLNETLTALSSETGVAFSYIPHRQEFLENIKRGAWHHVLKTIESVKLEASTVLSVYEHVVKELIIDKEYALAQALLKEQSVLLSLESRERGEGQLLQELWDLTQVREPPPTVEKCFPRQKYRSI